MRHNDQGASASQTGLSPSVEPASGLAGSAASIPSASADDMPRRMRRFLDKPPRRITPEAIAARRNKGVRKAKRRGILEEVCESQSWRCAYCRRSMRRKERPDKPWLTATLDHKLPISRGGRNDRANLCGACRGCNQAKGAATAEEFASAIEARRAETQSGSVADESAVPEADAHPLGRTDQ